MVRIYGHRWESSYGPADDGTWLHGLADVTLEQIGLGIHLSTTHHPEWPPTLGEFRALCGFTVAAGDARAARMAIEHAPVETDEHKADRLARGREQIRRIRDQLPWLKREDQPL